MNGYFFYGFVLLDQSERAFQPDLADFLFSLGSGYISLSLLTPNNAVKTVITDINGQFILNGHLNQILYCDWLAVMSLSRRLAIEIAR